MNQQMTNETINESNDVEGVDIGKKHKLGHLRVDQQGNMTFKRLPTNQLVQALQLGIQHAVGGLETQPTHDILIHDFQIEEIVEFPKQGRGGLKATPAHRFNDFTMRCYAPAAFRHFRTLFHIRPEDFLSSVNEPWRELKNPGASGSLFYLTADDQFIIKTVQKREASFLRSLLPGYYMNLMQNPRTLLPKFFGLFCYQVTEILTRAKPDLNGENKNIRITLMNNLIPSQLQMHEKYDLKGSTYKRRASAAERQKESPTWKDLDFVERHPNGLALDNQTYEALRETISRDCRVLESFSIMDYSLLLCIHQIDNSSETATNRTLPNGSSNDAIGNIPKRNLHHTPMDNIRAQFDESNMPDEFVAQTGGIPARDENGQRLSLYVGIIDILQCYQLKKKLEHAMKSMITDGSQISVTHPRIYSERFKNFLFNRVFKRTGPTRELPPTGKGKSTKTTDVPRIRPTGSKDRIVDRSSIKDSVSTGSTMNSRVSTYYSSLRSNNLSESTDFDGSSQTIFPASVRSDSLFGDPARPIKGKIVVTRYPSTSKEESRNRFYQNYPKAEIDQINPASLNTEDDDDSNFQATRF